MLVNGLQGFTYTVDLARGVSVGQEEDSSNVKYDTMCWCT